MPELANERVYGPQYKLIGKNYVTADLLAKVTGSQNTRKIFVPKACCSASCCSVLCRMPG